MREEVSVWTAYGGGWRREDRGGRRRTGTGMDDCSRTRGTKDPGQVRSPKVQGGGIGGFFSFSLLPAATRMEKRASIATPKATGSETSQCQDGPSRAYRRGRLWGVGGVWPENPTLTGDNGRQSQVGSTNIGIGNCAWGKRQLVNISGHGDRGMASSPSRGWMPIMDPRVWTFFFSRPSVDEMQSLQSPFVCPLPLPSCRLALTTSSCLCSSSPAPISVSTPQTPGHHRQEWIVANGASLLAPGPAIEAEGSAGRRARVANRGGHEQQVRLLANGSHLAIRGSCGARQTASEQCTSTERERSMPRRLSVPPTSIRHLHPAVAAMTARSAGHRQNATPALASPTPLFPFPLFFVSFISTDHASPQAADSAPPSQTFSTETVADLPSSPGV